MSEHSWCQDVPRDQAVRAAEDDAANWRRLEVGEVIEKGDEYLDERDGWKRVPHSGIAFTRHLLPHRRRRVPLPDHRELPQAVAELRERVKRLEDAKATIGSGDVFADVVCGSTDDEVVRLTAERDAARAELERQLQWVPLRASMEVARLKARVAELEAAPAVCDPASPVEGFRTERVTLEITQAAKTYVAPSGLIWTRCLGSHPQPGESVRVVDEADTVSDESVAHGVTLRALAETRKSLAAANRGIARLTAERDAARAEAERLRARLLRAEITRLREERRWIPVEERLPDQYEIVMVGWAGRRDIGKGYLHHGKWHDPLVCMPDANQPTHWQPLPAPPSEGEVEG